MSILASQETPTTEGAAPETAAPETAAPETISTGAPADRDGELPDWAREALTKANAEAANYRVRLRELEKAVKDTPDPEALKAEILAAQERAAAAERKAVIASVARDHGLPDALASRLTGATEEEIRADAAILAALIPSTAQTSVTETSGGLNPGLNSGDGEYDPRALARRVRRR